MKYNGEMILELFAASNVLSILEVGMLSVLSNSGYKKFHEYIKKRNVNESIKYIPLEIKNIKFNCALFLIKIRAFRLLYGIIVLLCKMNVNLIPENAI